MATKDPKPTTKPKPKPAVESQTKPAIEKTKSKSEPQASVTVVRDEEKGTITAEEAAAAAEKKKRAKIAKRDDALWLRETASLLLAFACFAVVIIILAVYGGRALPEWPALISINSLVAILLAVLRPTLSFPVVRCFDEIKWVLTGTTKSSEDLKAFDAATRGPWGAFFVLFKNFSKLATLGAVVMIVSIAVEPFIQQAILYQNCMVVVKNTAATVARTNHYLYGGTHIGAGQHKVDIDLASSLYLGMLQPPVNATASIAFGCVTGNCSIGNAGDMAYSSIAMCTHVEDISAQVQNVSSQMQGPYSQNYTLVDIDPMAFQSVNLSVFDQAGGVYMATSAKAAQMNGTPWEFAQFSFRALMLTAPCDDTFVYCGKPFAFDAYMYPCLQTYGNVSINQSVLHEEVLQTTPLVFAEPLLGSGEPWWSLAGNYPSEPGIDCAPAAASGGNKTAPCFPGTNGANNYDYEGLYTNNSLFYDPRCTWALGAPPTAELSSALSLFFGNGRQSEPNVPVYNLATGGSYSDPQKVDGPLWLQRLYLEGAANLNTTQNFMQGLAYSVTAMMRQNVHDDHTGANAEAQGLVLQNETCVSVVWPWFALPIVVVMLTILFLLGTMLAVRKSGKKRAPRNKVSNAQWNKITGTAQHQAVSMAGKGLAKAMEGAQDFF